MPYVPWFWINKRQLFSLPLYYHLGKLWIVLGTQSLKYKWTLNTENTNRLFIIDRIFYIFFCFVHCEALWIYSQAETGDRVYGSNVDYPLTENVPNNMNGEWFIVPFIWLALEYNIQSFADIITMAAIASITVLTRAKFIF